MKKLVGWLLVSPWIIALTLCLAYPLYRLYRGEWQLIVILFGMFVVGTAMIFSFHMGVDMIRSKK